MREEVAEDHTLDPQPVPRDHGGGALTRDHHNVGARAIEHSGDYRAAKTAYAAAYQYCDAHGADDVGQLCRACATAVLKSTSQSVGAST